ncbi:cupin domain-containing protein [Streptomyces sp. V2]|uniref:Cupin domain-containing protein n=1 Tax=Streptomyces niveiscabiei TaxID=164115 RepID=A0ABW9HYM0_9ACTN|nr:MULTISPECIES: cupin domain-containing protein [Streptomyces]PWG09752.1 cupin domain-containing protein [Streptomyces sp. V2]
MPVVRATEATTHELHGARFVSYATPRTGSRQLAAWRAEIPPRTKAPAHTVTHEEVLHLLTGTLRITLDTDTTDLAPGDTLIVNAGSTLTVENPTDHAASTWVTTSIGLTAKLADGTEVAPPWAN